MICIEPSADVLNSFHFRNQQWNAHELPLNSNNIKAQITWPFIIPKLLTLLFLLLQNADSCSL
jgi:hypothetical protein